MIYLTHAVYPYQNSDDERRRKRAERSWMDLPDDGPQLAFMPLAQPPHRHLRITELLDAACHAADDTDIIAYANSDAGLTKNALQLISRGIARGHGVTVCPRRSVVPRPDVLYDDLSAWEMDAGIDLVACSREWWNNPGRKMPPMYVGRGGWDMIFTLIAQVWADGKPEKEPLDRSTEALLKSQAVTDGVCWHEPHKPQWIGEKDCAEQLENVRLAVGFCEKIGNPDRVFC